MYGIPKEFNLDPLKGSKIVLIGRSFNTLNIYFDNKWSIISEGPIGIREINGSYILNSSDEWSFIDQLFSLIEKQINGWSTESSREFKVFFQDNTSTTFIDDSDHYELYHFEPNGWII